MSNDDRIERFARSIALKLYNDSWSENDLKYFLVPRPPPAWVVCNVAASNAFIRGGEPLDREGMIALAGDCARKIFAIFQEEMFIDSEVTVPSPLYQQEDIEQAILTIPARVDEALEEAKKPPIRAIA